MQARTPFPLHLLLCLSFGYEPVYRIVDNLPMRFASQLKFAFVTVRLENRNPPNTATITPLCHKMILPVSRL